MPKYGFKCPNGHEFDHPYTMGEIVQKPSPPCPECGEFAQRTFHCNWQFANKPTWSEDYNDDRDAHRRIFGS